jgi:hypothetical protein
MSDRRHTPQRQDRKGSLHLNVPVQVETLLFSTLTGKFKILDNGPHSINPKRKMALPALKREG